MYQYVKILLYSTSVHIQSYLCQLYEYIHVYSVHAQNLDTFDEISMQGMRIREARTEAHLLCTIMHSDHICIYDEDTHI